MTKPTPEEKCEGTHISIMSISEGGKRGYILGKSSPSPEAIYPCEDCGVMRTKDEGGTTFTVCDKCWDKKYKPSPETRCVYEHLPDSVCNKCGKYEPASEARVDWEKEAREIVFDSGSIACPRETEKHPSCEKENPCMYCQSAVEAITTALQLAFQNGKKEGLDLAKRAFKNKRFHKTDNGDIHFSHGCVPKEDCENQVKLAFQRGREQGMKATKVFLNELDITEEPNP